MKNVSFRQLLLCAGISLMGVGVEANAQKQLLPKPQTIHVEEGLLVYNQLSLNCDAGVSKLVQDQLKQLKIQIAKESKTQLSVKLIDTISGVKNNMDEAYSLSITPTGIELLATTPQGIYWGMQTLGQLVQENKQGKLPYLSITDWPAFRVRGFMQDVGRSYISMDELKREIAILSKYKVNVFHWHLTENQAWRLESKKYPQLTSSENMTRMQGKYYSHAEARELVEFCKAHNVTLIPELDMPGHSAAFKRAFDCDMQSEEGMAILKDLIAEACEVLDVPYLHIGTDEVEFTNPGFVPEMVDFVRAQGKKVISWNPGWNYKQGEVDMTQLWSYRGKATPGIPAIDSKFHYLNHFDTFADIYALYTSQIGNVAEGSEQYAGTILALWHDRYIANERNIILENYLYPNMLAIAERAWQGGGWQYFDDFGTTMQPNTEPYHAFKDFESRMLWHKANNFDGYPFAYVKQTNVDWNIAGPFPNEGNLTKTFEPEQVLKDTYVYEGNEVPVASANGAGIYLRHVWGTLVPGFYKEPKENSTAYAWTYVYSPKKQKVGLWFETQNYSRSEMDLAPDQGKWDYKESKIWINDSEIQSPVWTSVHREKSNEIPLGNENMVGRDPIEVQLNKGWNKVLIKLPIGKFSVPQVRLTKWMFSAVFVTPDGQQAVDGLIYSPNKKK